MHTEAKSNGPSDPRPTIRGRASNSWRRIAGRCSHFWSDIRPGPEARRGAAWGCAAAALAGGSVAGRFLKSGFGPWVDFFFCIGVSALIVLVSAGLIPLVLTIFRKLPRLISGLIFGCAFFIALVFMPVGIGVAPIVCLSAGILGASVATLFSAGFAPASTWKKAITIVLFALSLAATMAELVFLALDGTMEGVLKAEPKSPLPEQLAAPNPGETGSFKTRVIYYGTRGGNRRRPEFDKPDVATPTVDASKFFKDYKGWRRKLRKTYWGYDMDKLPLNATVWVPGGSGPFPLVLMVHGNHNMAEFSDPGYRYLGELLASRGFLFASIDENFLNSGLFEDPPQQQAVRGWMLLEHLKLWRGWSLDGGNPLGVAIDFSRIALMGHSRGGEAAATAALFNQLEHYPEDAAIRFDYHFPIRAIVAIAPADGQYKPAGQWRFIEDVSYFTIQGANDADVSSFVGSRQWDRVRYTGAGDWFKSELYIYRANHGQFNTVWGRSDAGYPLGWFLNLKPLLNPEDQRRIARIYLSAFLEAALHGRREYLPLFRDHRSIRSWLPDTLYISRYQDPSYKTVADFNEDPDVCTTTLPGGRIDGSDLSIWREGRIPFRQGDRAYNGVFLGWNRNTGEGKEDAGIKPSYSIRLPDTAALAWQLTGASTLVLSIAALDEDAPLLHEKEDKQNGTKPEPKKERQAPDFTVELETSDGIAASRPLSDFGTVLAPMKVRFSKIEMLDNLFYTKASEPVFQSVFLPLSGFARQIEFDPGRLKTIRLRFNRAPAGVILLSKIGFE